MRTFIAFDIGETLVDFHKQDQWYASLENEVIPLLFQDLQTTLDITPRHIDLDQFAAIANSSIVSREDKERSMHKRITHYLQDLQLPVVDEIITSQMERFFTTVERDAELYADVPLVLDSLIHEGYTLGIVSNTPWQCAGYLLDHLSKKMNILQFFPLRIYSGDIEISKPNPLILEKLQVMAQEKAENMMFVGDSEKDINVAANFGIPMIWMDRSGVMTLSESTPNPEYRIQALNEIWNILPLD
jgi:HAD superfamily hydrolase (TIGR01549 family)